MKQIFYLHFKYRSQIINDEENKNSYKATILGDRKFEGNIKK